MSHPCTPPYELLLSDKMVAILQPKQSEVASRSCLPQVLRSATSRFGHRRLHHCHSGIEPGRAHLWSNAVGGGGPLKWFSSAVRPRVAAEGHVAATDCGLESECRTFFFSLMELNRQVCPLPLCLSQFLSFSLLFFPSTDGIILSTGIISVVIIKLFWCHP